MWTWNVSRQFDEKDGKMKNCLICLTCVVALFVADMSVCIATTAGQPSGDELTIATGGRTQAVVVVSCISQQSRPHLL
jgi:hypothetical protein